jgi:hypothetical protein
MRLGGRGEEGETYALSLLMARSMEEVHCFL